MRKFISLLGFTYRPKYLVVIFQVLICFLATDNAFPAEDTPYKDSLSNKPNVIIMTICSVRNQDTIDDPGHRHMPRIFGELAEKGFLYTNLIENNFQFHIPALQAIITGLHHSNNFLPISRPSIFQYLVQQAGIPRDKVWSIAHWNQENIIFESDEFGEESFPSGLCYLLTQTTPTVSLTRQEIKFKISNQKKSESFSGIHTWPKWDVQSRAIHGIAKRIFSDIKPKFVHYLLNLVEVAHHSSYPAYIHAIRETEDQIMDIWNIIREDSFYKDNTYFLITVDHHRDKYHMGHSESWFTPRLSTWLYIFGPGIRKNGMSDEPVYHVDIFQTLSEIYGINTHPGDGRFLESCFEPGFSDRFRKEK